MDDYTYIYLNYILNGRYIKFSLAKFCTATIHCQHTVKWSFVGLLAGIIGPNAVVFLQEVTLSPWHTDNSPKWRIHRIKETSFDISWCNDATERLSCCISTFDTLVFVRTEALCISPNLTLPFQIPLVLLWISLQFSRKGIYNVYAIVIKEFLFCQLWLLPN